MYVCTYVRICMYVMYVCMQCAYACMYVCVYAMYICMYVYVCVYYVCNVHMYVCIMYTYIHTSWEQGPNDAFVGLAIVRQIFFSAKLSPCLCTAGRVMISHLTRGQSVMIQWTTMYLLRILRSTTKKRPCIILKLIVSHRFNLTKLFLMVFIVTRRHNVDIEM